MQTTESFVLGGRICGRTTENEKIAPCALLDTFSSLFGQTGKFELRARDILRAQECRRFSTLAAQLAINKESIV